MRHRRTALSAAFAASLSLGACTDAPQPIIEPVRAPGPTSAASFVDNGSNYGVAVNIDWHPSSANDYSHLYDAMVSMRSIGIGSVRTTAYWYDIQTGPNAPLDTSGLATQIRAITAAGLTPYITLWGTPCWAMTDACDIKKVPDTPANWQAFTSYVQQLMAAFPQVRAWGIWNEPNVSGFLMPRPGMTTLTTYRQLVDNLAPVIHGNGRTVIGPELANDFSAEGVNPLDWFSQLLDTHTGSFDALAVHLYGGTWLNGFPTGGLSDMQGFSAAMDQHGSTAELWLTEAGTPQGFWSMSAQCADLRAITRTMNGFTVPHWTRTYYYSAGTDDQGIMHNFGSPSGPTATTFSQWLGWYTRFYIPERRPPEPSC